MSDITCGKCAKQMTPENSRKAPELFMCDECVDAMPELKAAGYPISENPAPSYAAINERVKALEEGLLKCVVVLSGEAMTKSTLIDALESARALLEKP